MEFKHEPVLLNEVLQWLDPAPGGVFADGTLGGGGHSQRILERIGDSGALYGIDRDEDALRAATQRLQGFSTFHAIHGNFHDVNRLLPEGMLLDGGLLDLGVSSYQLDTPERGFSYHEDAPLEQALDDWMARIRPGGRLCVITFHSIEDRIVKHAFRRMQNPCTCPPQAPICTCGKKPVAKVMGGGAIRPTQEETLRNPRAHSATLRVAQKL